MSRYESFSVLESTKSDGSAKITIFAPTFLAGLTPKHADRKAKLVTAVAGALGISERDIITQLSKSGMISNASLVAGFSLCSRHALGTFGIEMGCLSAHAVDHLPLCRPIFVRLAQWWDAPEVTDHVLGLAKIHLLQQIAHLQLHVLNHLANVGNVRRIILNSHISLDLANHVTRQVKTTERFGVGAEGKNNGRGQLVVGGAGAVLRVEDVDAVPAARAALCGVDG